MIPIAQETIWALMAAQAVKIKVVIIINEIIKTMNKGKFPIFAIILLAAGIMWLLNDMEVVSVNIPWIPVVIIIVAAGMIFKKCCCCKDA